MKRIVLLLTLAVTAGAAQTTSTTKATTAAKPAVATAAKKTGTATATAAGAKLPPGVPAVKGIVKTAFTATLRYQDIKVGTGAEAEPGKMYKVLYTGWLASDGKKFDSTDDHRAPLRDKDGKPETDADGKPKLGDPQPFSFPQGSGRLIPGWDQGFEGMKVGGKRRLFIPYRLAYGAMGRPPVIPAKSDLIFDIELVEVADMPSRPMPGMPGGRPMPPRPGATPTTPGAPAPGSPSTSAPAPKPAEPATPPATAPATPTPTPTPVPTPTPTDKPANPEQPK